MVRARIRDSGNVLRTIKKIRMRDSGNILRSIKRVRMRDSAGTLRTVWQGGDTQLMTTGSLTLGDDVLRGFDYGGTEGYSGSAYGSLSDGTSSLYSESPIRALYWRETNDGINPVSRAFELRINGIHANSGWTSITSSNGQTYNRADATFTASLGRTVWAWGVTGTTTLANNPCNGNPTFTFNV